MKPIAAMTLAEIQVELRAYQPANSAAVIATDTHKTQRYELWCRLDEPVATQTAAKAA